MPLASPRYAFTRTNVLGAPHDPGLYALYWNDELICIGVALARDADDGLRGRLLAHLHSAKGRISHYQWEINSNPLLRRTEYLTRLGRSALRCEDLETGSPTAP